MASCCSAAVLQTQCTLHTASLSSQESYLYTGLDRKGVIEEQVRLAAKQIRRSKTHANVHFKQIPTTLHFMASAALHDYQ